MSLEPTTTVRSNPSCLLTELGDGTGVLLDLTTKFYFTLNETGVFVWKSLVQREPTSVEALVASLVEAFEVAPDVAQVDVSALVDELLRAGLCTRGA